METWKHDPVPPPQDSDKTHTVVDMKGINLAALGMDLAWSEEDDHAKLAVSARSEQVHYVCVGDPNYTIAQRKRGGGTVAFRCEALWTSIASILEGVSTFPRAKGARPRSAARKPGARKTTARKTTTRKTTARKPAARNPAAKRTRSKKRQ